MEIAQALAGGSRDAPRQVCSDLIQHKGDTPERGCGQEALLRRLNPSGMPGRHMVLTGSVPSQRGVALLWWLCARAYVR